ncbi:MAG: DUF6062 family protein [Oscillospiraceae bacterium]|jgi:hypothetical protein|nr:DUF6062 family protein [Oscillospiraceae bacterium]
MFNQHIDTAPVLEAFAAGGECPLCTLRNQTEEGYLDQFLGGSVMVPAMRVLVNEKGFCARHFAQLYESGNHLGLALMTHTHMKEAIAALEKRWMEPKKGVFWKRAAQDGEARGSCALCDRLDSTMDRYIKTVVWLWSNDKPFRERYNASLGLCVAHADAVLAATTDGAMRAAVIDVELRNLKRVEKELEWFTLKFDYRNNDKPWGDSKDALPRAIQKLAGASHQHKGE